jgi:hypothetical protein
MGEEFAHRPQFEVVRSFISYGEEPSLGIVFVNTQPILLQEILLQRRVTNGHILTVEVHSPRPQTEVRLSQFNAIRYRIVLSTGYSEIWYAKGRHFDLDSHERAELTFGVE